MNELSLFTGAGGGVLGSKLLGWKTIGYIEYEPYCQKILKQRIADGILDAAPIFGDIRAFNREGYAESYKGVVDVVTAGFPCQPFSVAGKNHGENDERNMWPETLEVIRTIRPQYALLENVPGLLAHEYFGRILGDLAESGYDARWKVISAAEVGAPHKRDRLWIFCHSYGNGESRLSVNAKTSELSKNMADPESSKCECTRNSRSRRIRFTNSGCTWWATDPANIPDTNEKRRESGGCGRIQSIGESFECGSKNKREAQSCMGRVAHGVANRVDRLRAIGNGQVPAVVRAAWNMKKLFTM